jgi:glycosyltransferase involved in cell wall biosynthesis
MRFSIVTPSFNQLEWLKLCVASVRDQALSPAPSSPLPASPSTPPIEHIVMDAGTPGIEDLARELGAEFHRNGQLVFEANPSAIGCTTALKIFSETDAGMYDAINKGLSRADGDICAYLNCDEQYLEGALQRVAYWISKNPAIDIAFGNIVVTDSSGNYLCDRTAVLPSRWHTMTSGNLSVFSGAAFFRRSVVERGLAFDPSWRIVGDSVWIISLLQAHLKAGLLRQRLASFAYSRENLSQHQGATEERRRLRAMAPVSARLFAPLAIILSRFRRLLAGGYSLKPHSYKIFTRGNADRRREFQALKPTHRWPSAN